MEERFAYAKPSIGKAKEAVIIDDDVRGVHPLLKVPIQLGLGDLVSVVSLPGVEDDEIILRRDPEILTLGLGTLADPNVLLVLRSPVAVKGFKYGAEHGLLISARQRRQGIVMDALALTLEDSDAFSEALARRHVRVLTSSSHALREVIGQAVGPDAVLRRRGFELGRLRARASFLFYGLVWIVVFGAQPGLRWSDGSVSMTVVFTALGVSLAWATLAAATVMTWKRCRPSSTKASPAGHRLLLHATVQVGIAALTFALPSWAGAVNGPLLLLLFGMAVGVPGGLICGFGLRLTRHDV